MTNSQANFESLTLQSLFLTIQIFQVGFEPTTFGLLVPAALPAELLSQLGGMCGLHINHPSSVILRMIEIFPLKLLY